MLRTIYYALEESVVKSEAFKVLEELVKDNNRDLKMWQEAPLGDLPQGAFSNTLLITDREVTKLQGLQDATCHNKGSGYPCPILGYQPCGSNRYLPYKYICEDISALDMGYLEMVYRRFHGIPLDILETKRLYVRELTIEDVDRLYEIYAHPSITEYMEGLYEDREEEINFTRSYIENMYGFYGYGLWGVCEKESGVLIGRAGLGNRELNGNTELELGYVIGADYQQKGYATEVCEAILDYARDELFAERIICLINPHNIPSKKLAIKLGFEDAGEVSLGEDVLRLYVKKY